MGSNEVTQKDLHDLLEIFERKSFEAGACEDGSMEQVIMRKCEALFKLDYTLNELDNSNGILSPRYPERILIPECEHGYMAATLTSSNGLNSFGTNSSSSNNPTQATTTCNGGIPGAAAATTTSATNAAASSKAFVGAGCGNGAVSGLQTFVTFANAPLQQLQQQQQQEQAGSKPTQPSTMHFTALQLQPQQQQQVQQQQHHTIYEDLYDFARIREYITMAKYARCRQRFAVPVIMYRGKYICRSATISVMPETYGRKVVDYAYDCLNGTNYAERSSENDENTDPTDESLINHMNNESSQFSYDEVIKSDIQLLTALNVATIVDLMVEKRKIKYFMPVSSSEKADPENHYENFNILSLPYPGCEFFKKFRDNNYIAKSLHYNWQQSFNDANISIPKLGPATDLDICWSEYKQWDLVLITQNYLKAALKYIQEEQTGLLIHCISGWDRTPLFVSLVRLSLWADGLIHQSLNHLQMTYFTLAYDWYLFGHQLPDRLKRGEDIMFFCFHVLKFIAEDEFSLAEQSSGSSSVIVIKADCDEEPLKEEYLLNFDQDSNSNESYSNGSNCDTMSITDNFFTTTTANATATTATCTMSGTANNILTSRSPNPKRSKTSPITVPGASATRQRQESTSSNGSWQVVTETGSIDSTMNGSYMMHFAGQGDGFAAQSNNIGAAVNGGSCYPALSITPSISLSSGSGSSGSSNGYSTIQALSMAAKDVPNTKTIPASLRKQRLNSVRAIFIQAYGKTIGLKFKEGSTMNFFGALAEQLF